MQISNTFSSVRGKIRKLFMSAPDTRDIRHFERLAAIRDKMPTYCSVVVWCNNEETRDALHQFLDGRGYRGKSVLTGTIGEVLPANVPCLLLLPNADNQFYSRWTRDSFLFKRLQNGNIEILKSSIQKLNDDSWADDYLRYMKFEGNQEYVIAAESVPVAGGNILFDQDFILVGAKQFRNSYRETGQDFAIQALLQTFNNGGADNFTRVIEIGGHTENEPERLVHIDLYISLTASWDVDNRYIVLVGRCELLHHTADPYLVKMVESMNDYQDAVAADLSTKGFSVLRNPIPVVKSNITGIVYPCTYNNCLSEVTASAKKVWLPQATYGQESSACFSKCCEIEQENAAIWASLGFDVAFIEAEFHTIMDDEGALHCISNELDRAPE